MQTTVASNPAPTQTSHANPSSGDADLAQLLSGADPNDPLVQEALAQLLQSKKQDDEKDPSRKRKKDDA